MAESIAPIQAAATPQAQYQVQYRTQATAISEAERRAAAQQAASLALQFDQTASLAAANNNESGVFSPLFGTQAGNNTDIITGTTNAGLTADVLIALNSTSLSLLNEVGNNQQNNNDGTLTPEQLEELARLRADILQLQAAASLAGSLPLAGASTALNISGNAQDLTLALSTLNGEAASTLGNTQLEQLANVFIPLANVPLTPELLSQLRAQLNASADLASLRLTLNNIFMIMSYIASMQPAQVAARDSINAQPRTEHRVQQVEPVSPVDKAGAEDIAIL